MPMTVGQVSFFVLLLAVLFWFQGPALIATFRNTRNPLPALWGSEKESLHDQDPIKQAHAALGLNEDNFEQNNNLTFEDYFENHKTLLYSLEYLL